MLQLKEMEAITDGVFVHICYYFDRIFFPLIYAFAGRSRATKVEVGGFSFMFGLVMTATISFGLVW